MGLLRKEPEERKAEILQMAHKMFVEGGFAKVSLQQIADELNITKGALFYHFKTKEEILVTLFRTGLTPLINFFEKTQTSNNSAIQKLQNCIDYFLGTMIPLGTEQYSFMRNTWDILSSECENFEKMTINPFHEKIIVQGIAENTIHLPINDPKKYSIYLTRFFTMVWDTVIDVKPEEIRSDLMIPSIEQLLGIQKGTLK